MTSTPYTLISSDCHAGASHDKYRTYLDAKDLDDFDAWRAKYKNPFRDLQGDERDRNWNNDRRIRELEDDGTVAEARIVPPTSQNQASIEEDLASYIEGFLDLPDEALRHRCEQTVRNYDPCISCATHFLRLDVDRG